jgi:uncharacterized protein
MRWPLPRDDKFFELFERSAATMVAAGEALESLFTDGPITAERFQPLDVLEHQADTITHEVVTRLGRTFITPLDRDDIYRLIHIIDDVIDAAEAAGEAAVLCRIDAVPDLAIELCQVLSKITREVAGLVPYLRGGNGHRSFVVRAHELETVGDKLWTEAFASLFDGHLEPLDVIKWKEIYQLLEDAIDASESAAQIIEEIVYKQA